MSEWFASFFGGFQVVDLQVFACPRITLKPLVPSFPCFANIYVSLMEKVSIGYILRTKMEKICSFIELVYKLQKICTGHRVTYVVFRGKL